ncbi:unnamed protein product [Didymodactylos carnosus]|uniref:Uncharacterized protein n=1 Tax=Didymodactylos carnosus TaxID=1234261 RepID=A0A8S2G9K1_9BILA|nr:unnamed protein product [Didymodactylos carnosus]CAF4477637.1 unnamed protein product [Didymodactylos carnosus]
MPGFRYFIPLIAPAHKSRLLHLTLTSCVVSILDYMASFLEYHSRLETITFDINEFNSLIGDHSGGYWELFVLSYLEINLFY